MITLDEDEAALVKELLLSAHDFPPYVTAKTLKSLTEKFSLKITSRLGGNGWEPRVIDGGKQK